VGLPVENLDRAIGFYRDVLGLHLIANPGALAFFDLDGVRLLLEAGDKGTGSVLYLVVPDIKAARAELQSRGVIFLDEPHIIYRDVEGTFGPAGEDEWMTFFHDSEGNLLALSSREFAPPS
jgi:catechol 2,3-dioxygenase-like lactoylglutathione lyase family enzyme